MDETLAPLAPRRLSRLRLHQRDAIGTAYHVLTFEAETPLDARAGQFAMVRSATWGSAPLLPRPMSLLTAGDRPSILIKVVGEGTQRMAHASTGEPFDLLMPLGRPWNACPPDRRAVLVAGGVGVAPLLFLARELSANGKRPLALYGGRSTLDLPLDTELGACADLRVATEDGSRGTRGRVTVLLEEALAELATRGEQVKVYTCGPDAMMAAVARMCETRGVPCEVSLETPMACGYGVCLGCPVPRRESKSYLYACTEGPCIDAAAIDWSRGGMR
ncbi:Dihydroorotate dehydrogenase electron transfer subunit protein [Minicystis rosea]|nr:Dihydroorotate dehydrogenase electron transfer subunit protein [Minicystis rosea]